MLRRVHVPEIRTGSLDLPENEAHHLRDVLRLKVNDGVELFDAAGRTATGVITHLSQQRVSVAVEQVDEKRASAHLTIASALPKGERADWMIEKLSELGVDRFIPLQTARSVVHPQGVSKIDRWNRIAAEAAKQSRRSGIMIIEPITHLAQSLDRLTGQIVYLSPAAKAQSLASYSAVEQLTLLIGPEGGWSDEEITLFKTRSVPPARLTSTVLRVETAAITAAAIVQCNSPESF